MERVQLIAVACAQVRVYKKSSETLGKRFKELNQLHLSDDQLFQDTLQFLNKFASPKLISLSWFENLLDDHYSDLSSFEDLNRRIQTPFSFPASLKVQYRMQDCEDIKEDLNNFFQEISVLQNNQHDSHELQLRCLNLSNQSCDTHDSMVVFQNQVKGLVKEFASPSYQNHNANSDESQKVRSQLTQIHSTIEDLNCSNNLIPQQERLISELNDSLVASLNEVQQSILETFSLELNQLKQSLQEEAKLRTKEPQLLSTFEKIEFSRKDKALREKKLTQLRNITSLMIDENSFLGRGTFAKVKSGRLGDIPVAIKIIQAEGRDAFSPTMKSAIENEILLASLCDHDHVIKFFGYCDVDPRTTHLILELGSMGSLWSILENKERFPSIPISLSIAWMVDILSALSYLHQHKIIHRDVKAENVLVCDGLVCKLSDFGVSKQQMESSFGVQSINHGGTLSFMAPETLPPQCRYSHRSDVYSCGVTCFQIISRSRPLSPPSTMIRFLESSYHFPRWSEFLNGCLAPDTVGRLSAQSSLRLLLETQACESVRGDPRHSFDHPSFHEVQRLCDQRCKTTSRLKYSGSTLTPSPSFPTRLAVTPIINSETAHMGMDLVKCCCSYCCHCVTIALILLFLLLLLFQILSKMSVEDLAVRSKNEDGRGL
jgi:hypothetical protein